MGRCGLGPAVQSKGDPERSPLELFDWHLQSGSSRSTSTNCHPVAINCSRRVSARSMSRAMSGWGSAMAVLGVAWS